MTKNEIAEKVVKDYCSTQENKNLNSTVLNSPVSSSPEALPEYRKEYSFEYNGKKICGGHFNSDSARSFAQGMVIGFRQFRKTAEIEVYTLNPRRLEWIQQ